MLRWMRRCGNLLLQPVAREEIRQALLARYFPLTRHYFRPRAGQEKLDELGRQMLEEPAAVYNRAVDVADETEVLVRSAVFGREVLRAYRVDLRGVGAAAAEHHGGGAAAGCLPHCALVGEPR